MKYSELLQDVTIHKECSFSV